jgi:hypothetical protein
MRPRDKIRLESSRKKFLEGQKLNPYCTVQYMYYTPGFPLEHKANMRHVWISLHMPRVPTRRRTYTQHRDRIGQRKTLALGKRRTCLRQSIKTTEGQCLKIKKCHIPYANANPTESSDSCCLATTFELGSVELSMTASMYCTGGPPLPSRICAVFRTAWSE